jgi:fructokinase
MQVLSIGEVLWDLFPDQELLGGAPLNFCAHLVRLGHTAALITAVGQDQRGRAAQDLIAALGVNTSLVEVVADRPTGVAVVTMSPEGEPRFAIPRPAAFDCIRPSPELLRQARELKPDWLYFGTLVHTEPHAEAMTFQLARALPGVRCFYDMNLRPGSWNLPLVQRLSSLASVLKLNEWEARTLGELTGLGPAGFSVERFCETWATQYGIESICVTLGPAGCLVYEKGKVDVVSGFSVDVKDTVGAGDAFAAAFLHGYHLRRPVVEAARFANAVGAVVAGQTGAIPPWSLEECCRLASLPMEVLNAH